MKAFPRRPAARRRYLKPRPRTLAAVTLERYKFRRSIRNAWATIGAEGRQVASEEVRPVLAQTIGGSDAG